VAEVDILNLFNEANVLDKDNDIYLFDFPADNPAYGLITQAQSDSCTLAGNRAPCLLAAYANFQNNGAPAIANIVNTGPSRSPTWNLANTFQGPRTVRLGVRFIF
jgi:hypothetical protein